ncbi:hypothetical protein HNQ71_006682 [Mesorhizobium sangaii]|uniref:Uncharacterized protein n=1 Tax=Mesorhizobium sangaii TaxID=505389 RepID=A0A841PK13_9HYPH|nr:hypothetical protein [Mesorhizobium sangaii]
MHIILRLRHGFSIILACSDFAVKVPVSAICGRKDSVNFFEGSVAMFWLSGMCTERLKEFRRVAMSPGRQFNPLCVRWYLACNLGLRDLPRDDGRARHCGRSTAGLFASRLCCRNASIRRKRGITGRWHIDEIHLRFTLCGCILTRVIDSSLSTAICLQRSCFVSRAPNCHAGRSRGHQWQSDQPGGAYLLRDHDSPAGSLPASAEAPGDWKIDGTQVLLLGDIKTDCGNLFHGRLSLGDF